MNPEQLEREAADRVRRMGYDNDLSDAERWRRFDADAQLVVSAYIDLRERVRELEAVKDAAVAYLSVPREAKKDADGIYHLDFVPQQNAYEALVEAIALAGGSDG